MPLAGLSQNPVETLQAVFATCHEVYCSSRVAAATALSADTWRTPQWCTTCQLLPSTAGFLLPLDAQAPVKKN